MLWIIVSAFFHVTVWPTRATALAGWKELGPKRPLIVMTMPPEAGVGVGSGVGAGVGVGRGVGVGVGAGVGVGVGLGSAITTGVGVGVGERWVGATGEEVPQATISSAAAADTTHRLAT
jgi:hypothetical protein